MKVPDPLWVVEIEPHWWREAKDEVNLREGKETFQYKETIFANGHAQGIVAERAFARWTGVMTWPDDFNRRPTGGWQCVLAERTVKVAGAGRIAEGISVKVPHKSKTPRKTYADIYVGFRVLERKIELHGWCLGSDMRARPIYQATWKTGTYKNDYQLMQWSALNRDLDLLRTLLALDPLPSQGALF